MQGMIPPPMPTTLQYLACLEGKLFILSSFNKVIYFYYSVHTRSLVSAPFLELIMGLHRLGSWHVRRLFFLRLLAEVSSSLMYMCQCRNFVIIGACNVGLHVTEVAHDIQAQVAKYIRETLGLVNSYDTWHGTVVFHAVYIVTNPANYSSYIPCLL